MLRLWHSNAPPAVALHKPSQECVLLKRHTGQLSSHLMSIPRVWEPSGRVGTHFMLLTVIKIGVCVWKEIKTSAACSKCIINSTAPPTDAQRAHTTRKNPPPRPWALQSAPGEKNSLSKECWRLFEYMVSFCARVIVFAAQIKWIAKLVSTRLCEHLHGNNEPFYDRRFAPSTGPRTTTH